MGSYLSNTYKETGVRIRIMKKIRYIYYDTLGVLSEVRCSLRAWLRDTHKIWTWFKEDVSYRIGTTEAVEKGEPIQLEWSCYLCGEPIERPSREVRLEIISTTSTIMANIHKEGCSSWVIKWLDDENRLFRVIHSGTHPKITVPTFTWADVSNDWCREKDFESTTGLRCPECGWDLTPAGHLGCVCEHCGWGPE
jgi:hypothetical protein